ncbi:MAG: type II secretion system F family protein, partial [Pseudomonadales bacterium]
SKTIEQAGRKILAYRLVLLAIVLSISSGIIVWIFSRILPAALGAAMFMLAIPFWKVRRDRDKRMERLEEQMPEALDVLRRALMAGHPFNAALNLVAEDMHEPISREFRLTFADINYGNDVRRALLGLLSRIPSVTVMAFVTSVLVQKETGGNLAEILSQISAVIRGRYKFQRRVKTLSAEGRMSAQILAMVPIMLVGALTLSSPNYLPIMFEDPLGRQLLMFTVFWGGIGVLIIRRLLRIEV